MLDAPVLIAVSLFYLGLLFSVALWGDIRADQGRSIIANRTIYALSMAVYCTTWTFYGSVGRAAVSGIGFLPVYLGPTLVMALGWFGLLKMIRIVKANRITSIAGFISLRYGKSHLLGGLVTVIAIVGIIPYIALQLEAVSSSVSLLLSYPEIIMPNRSATMPVAADITFYFVLILAAFTIVFGTRHLDATERHEGVVAAIAVDSVVKLVAFMAVGVFVTYGLYDGFGDIFEHFHTHPELQRLATAIPSGKGYTSWFSLLVLSAMTVLFLPSQFQVAVVENGNEAHLKRAAWLFPLYLLLINIFVLPIALGGLLHFAGQGVDADTFVLTLPLSQRSEGLTLLVFIGGLSAATGMVIVETIALSTMVCNDLVLPLLLRHNRQLFEESKDLSGLLFGIRRGAIVVILLLGYLYFRLVGGAYALFAIGLISFAAVAQFAPAMIGGMYWRGATRGGALAGLSAGFLIWTYTLLLPSFAKSGWLPDGFLTQGLLGIDLLRPQQLFGLTGFDEISHCLFWSFFANIGAYVGVSLLRPPMAAEARQAAVFVDALKDSGPVGVALWRARAKVSDLQALVGRFLGPALGQSLFAGYARGRGFTSSVILEADAHGKPVSSSVRRSLLRRLDYMPGGRGMALGVGAGALLGGGVALASPLVAAAGFITLLGLAVVLAFSGEPITVIDSPVNPETGERAENAPAVTPTERPVDALPSAPPLAGGVALVSIPGGAFLMGSPEDEAGRGRDEGPVHEQRIAAFDCMPHLVTRRLYRELMGQDPGLPADEADERPVISVSWYDALAFCNELSKRAGLAPCYRLEAPSRAECDQAADGYRLPTEAEWEYACRAGSRTRYSFGDDERQLAEHAWYMANSGAESHPVGQKEPNRWGLHDMHGNVWEWCWDDYGPYPSEARDRPMGNQRVLRGGSFNDSAGNLRSALRYGSGPGVRGGFVGFRCVRSPRR